LSVVLPPEKAEGCESYLQYLRSAEGAREILLRDASKAPGKKRISLNVSNTIDFMVYNTPHPCNIHLLILVLVIILILLILSTNTFYTVFLVELETGSLLVRLLSLPEENS